MRTRINLVLLGFLIMFLLLLGKLFYWQIYKGRDLSLEAKGQYDRGKTLQASRGDILAADGSWLVARAQGWFVYSTNPDINKNSSEVANELAPLLANDAQDKKSVQDEKDYLNNLLSKKNQTYLPIKHRIDDTTKQNIDALKINGINFDPEEISIYPEASTAAHLLGFVGKNEAGNDQGYFGLEGYYDLPLSGKPGFLSRTSDARGNPLLFGDSTEVSAIGGVELVTNIDKSIQIDLDQKLQEGIEKYGATGGEAIIMNPQNGAIIAMSENPSYDPAKYVDYSNELFKDPSIASSFEPGSIFKVVVMASAIDAGLVTPDTVCDICSGPLKVDKYLIETWNKVYFPNTTMTDVIVHSDNVGMSFVAQKLGRDKMYKYLSSFGIGQLTGIDLQGESTPKLRDLGNWGPVELVTAGFGQGIAVTPIQIVRAVAAIANGGHLVTPEVVKEIQKDGWNEIVKPVIGPQIISEKAASEVSQMMGEAAQTGEAKWTYIPGYKVAGKTGTAQIPIEGHYDPTNTIASFIGFAPYDNPKFVMLVTLTKPQTSQWAADTAAPLWYSIAKDLFDYLGIQPEK